MRVDGVLGAGRGGGLGAVAAGAVQRIPAAPRGLGIQRAQRQRQLIAARAGLRGEEHREELQGAEGTRLHTAADTV